MRAAPRRVTCAALTLLLWASAATPAERVESLLAACAFATLETAFRGVTD
eukprot:gene55315-11081_t